MQPNEIACRHCAAQPNEPCKDEGWITVLGVVKRPLYLDPHTDEPIFHQERVIDAAGWNEGSPQFTKEQVEAAIAATDLV